MLFSITQAIKLAIKNNNINKITSSAERPIKVDIKGKQKKIISSKKMSKLLHEVFTGGYKNQVLDDFAAPPSSHARRHAWKDSARTNIDQDDKNWKIITIINYIPPLISHGFLFE